MKKRAVVVTGTSTGIGESTAAHLIQQGFHVFGSVRRENDGERLRGQLGDAFIPLNFDVTDEDAIKRAASQVEQALGGATLAGLVNNAGIATSGPLAHLPLKTFRDLMHVNLFGAVAVTQAFLPLLGCERARTGRPGRIVNVSSVAGKQALPFTAVYSASKHALEAVSESLRRELLLFGIDVIIVAPGPVATPIWNKGGKLDTTSYQETEYGPALARFKEYAADIGPKGYPPERIARVIHEALTTASPKTRYAPVKGKFVN